MGKRIASDDDGLGGWEKEDQNPQDTPIYEPYNPDATMPEADDVDH